MPIGVDPTEPTGSEDRYLTVATEALRSAAPKGPSGLMRALLRESASTKVGPVAMDVADVASFTARGSAFDYDVALALDLDGQPVDGALVAPVETIVID